MEEKLKKINDLENEIEMTKLDAENAIKSMEMADKLRVCAEYEYEQLQFRFKNRENELTEMLKLSNTSKNENATDHLCKIIDLEKQIFNLDEVSLLYLIFNSILSFYLFLIMLHLLV